MSFPRSLLCKLLYEGLGPEHQRKIRTGAAVEDIAVNERGVRVMLADGTTEAGSLLVGADGVHSTTRQFIRRQVQAERGTASGGADGNASQEEDDDTSDEPLTTFQCLYCNHENSVVVNIDKKAGVGNLHCKVCGQSFQTGINCMWQYQNL